MIKVEKISASQFMVLVCLFIIGSTVLILPAALAGVAKQDAWISGLLGIGYSLLLVYFYSSICSLYPSTAFPELLEKILGKWIGRLFILLYCGFAFFLASLTLRDAGDFLKTQIIPETPIYAIQLLMLIAVVVALLYGIETFARASELFFPIVIFVVLVPVILLMKDINFDYIKPIFEHGFVPIFEGSLLMISIPFLELVLLLAIYPLINDQKKARKYFFIGVSLGGFFILLKALLTILTIGVGLTSSISFPAFFSAKKINIADFLQRIEALIAIQWIVTSFVKLSLCMYVALNLFARLFQVSSYRILVFPSVLIVLAIAQAVPPFTSSIRAYVAELWIPFVLFFGLLLPLVIFIVGLIRKKREEKSVKA
ncbi:GerAB/ArcD/ProY family transporter [Alkalihalobacillus sp. 1P02AB]|uniref:GerAB/ArcD/ProY family transporter n=1 Tax=Alkalihalobacillus sp. 1P02AB TaxID=3132260 RepID=UPI0039A61970